MAGPDASSRPYDLGERTFLFACAIVRLCAALESRGGVARRIGLQLVDCGTSVGANYQESQGDTTPREFLVKQQIVLREAREARYWLQLAEACGLADKTVVRPLIAESTELVAIFRAATLTAKIALRRAKRK
jgi:four helix bundle protein